MSERKLTKEGRKSLRPLPIRGDDDMVFVHHDAYVALLDDLDAADAEILDWERLANHNQQLITTMVCDASEMRGYNIMLRALLKRVVGHVTEDGLTSELIFELQEAGVLE